MCIRDRPTTGRGLTFNVTPKYLYLFVALVISPLMFRSCPRPPMTMYYVFCTFSFKLYFPYSFVTPYVILSGNGIQLQLCISKCYVPQK